MAEVVLRNQGLYPQSLMLVKDKLIIYLILLKRSSIHIPNLTYTSYFWVCLNFWLWYCSVERSFRHVTQNCEYMRDGMIHMSLSLPRRINDYVAALRGAFIVIFTNQIGWDLDIFYLICLQVAPWLPLENPSSKSNYTLQCTSQGPKGWLVEWIIVSNLRSIFNFNERFAQTSSCRVWLSTTVVHLPILFSTAHGFRPGECPTPFKRSATSVIATPRDSTIAIRKHSIHLVARI